MPSKDLHDDHPRKGKDRCLFEHLCIVRLLHRLSRSHVEFGTGFREVVFIALHGPSSLVCNQKVNQQDDSERGCISNAYGGGDGSGAMSSKVRG